MSQNRQSAGAAAKRSSTGTRGTSTTSQAELFRRSSEHGDRAARDELVLQNLPLARKLAGRYARRQEPIEDLYQVACLGLVQAVDRFDPERGLSFATFAVPTILGQLKRHFRDKGWPLHLPRGLQELILKVQAADQALHARLGRSPTVPEIAERLECDTETVVEALDALNARNAASLDAPLDQSTEAEAHTHTHHDVVGKDDDRYDLVDLQASITAAMNHLTAEDQQIMALRFGDGLTQREIASRIGISQMQVSRILRRIREEMRDDLELPLASAAYRASRTARRR